VRVQKRAELVGELSGFWPTVLVSHERLSELISEDDEEALQSLSGIEVHEFDDIKSGYKIDFVRSPHRHRLDCSPPRRGDSMLGD